MPNRKLLLQHNALIHIRSMFWPKQSLAHLSGYTGVSNVAARDNRKVASEVSIVQWSIHQAPAFGIFVFLLFFYQENYFPRETKARSPFK